jgi:hypothetical protein
MSETVSFTIVLRRGGKLRALTRGASRPNRCGKPPNGLVNASLLEFRVLIKATKKLLQSNKTFDYQTSFKNWEWLGVRS